MKKTILLASIVIGTAMTSFAQFGMGGSNVILKSGDLKVLKNEKVITTKYDYSNVKVGAFNSESEYVDKKVKEYNEKEKGKGDKWKAGWIGARKERFEPKFEEVFNKKAKKIGTTVSSGAAGTKYTLIVKTTFIEPGMNIGIAKKPAFANFEFTFVETANPGKIVAELYLNNVIGSSGGGFDFDAGSRIAESYAKGGKMLAGFIVKQLK